MRRNIIYIIIAVFAVMSCNLYENGKGDNQTEEIDNIDNSGAARYASEDSGIFINGELSRKLSCAFYSAGDTDPNHSSFRITFMEDYYTLDEYYLLSSIEKSGEAQWDDVEAFGVHTFNVYITDIPGIHLPVKFDSEGKLIENEDVKLATMETETSEDGTWKISVSITTKDDMLVLLRYNGPVIWTRMP